MSPKLTMNDEFYDLDMIELERKHMLLLSVVIVTSISSKDIQIWIYRIILFQKTEEGNIETVSTENWFLKPRILTAKSLLLESIVYWGSFEMNCVNLTRNNCRWCSMLFKTCYCLDLWKYDEINYAFSDVRLEQYYSNTAKYCQKRGCVCARTASRLTGFTVLANAELFLKDFLLVCWLALLHTW